MVINYPDAVAIAKSATELAIQQNFITSYDDAKETAKEIADFYRVICEELSTDSSN